MNTDERILQILDNSACLSKSQLVGYLKHTLYPEELRAVELHLSSCALCNDALEGLELQQDAEQLLASMTLPALPALPPREKPKEKKEIPVVAAREEKAHAAAPAAKNIQQPGTEAGSSYAFRPRKSFARPIGIAAALALAFGALWYFEFRKKDTDPQLAEHMPAAADTNLLAANSKDSNPGASPAMEAASDAAAKAEAEKKHKDSLLLAKKTEARLKAQLDSTKAIAVQTEPQPMATMAETADAPAEKDAAKAMAARKVAAATPPKEESKEESKKELSDFELGMQKYRDKNYASALLYFKSAESDKGDPKHWDAVYYSGLCNRFLNKDRRARKLFERVVDAGAPQKKAAQKQLDDMKKKDNE